MALTVCCHPPTSAEKTALAYEQSVVSRDIKRGPCPGNLELAHITNLVLLKCNTYQLCHAFLMEGWNNLAGRRTTYWPLLN